MYVSGQFYNHKNIFLCQAPFLSNVHNGHVFIQMLEKHKKARCRTLLQIHLCEVMIKKAEAQLDGFMDW